MGLAKKVDEAGPAWIGAAAAVVAAVAAVLGLAATGTFTGDGNPAVPGPVSTLTVTDAVNGGAWARADPDQGTLPPRTDRPSNAIAWLPNGRKETPICAKSAATYPVVFATQHQVWRWWAELRDRSWLPMAAFRETTHVC
jgi:hypothetical protein